MAIPGSRTLVDTLRYIAEQRPDATAIHHIVLDEGKEKSALLTYAELVSRIDELSWWLNDKITTGKIERFSTVAYLAPNDLRTLLLPLAAAECNLVAFLLSPRNSFEAQEHLIKTNHCSALIVDKVFDHVADHIKSVKQIAAPDLWHILSRRSCLIGRFSTPSTWEKVCHAGLVRLHTSGSTGLPKSVLISHAVLSTVDAQRNVKDSQDQQCQLAIFGEAERPYTAFPFFHVAGFELACFILFSGSTIVLGPPHQPTSLEIVQTVLRVAKSDALLLPPSILDDIVTGKSLLEEVCQAKLLYYGGGQVSQHTGDVLSKKTRLFNGIGSTEVGSICLMPLPPQDWNYFHFTPENGIAWQPVGTGTGEYEMVIVKDDGYNQYQAVFHSFPELSEWRTKDIFAKHPSVEGLWDYRGRLDDLIVLSTGEKVNPTIIEAVIVKSCPGVKSAIVVGSKRPRPALLVELTENSRTASFDEDRLRNEIASSLASGNLDAVSRDGQVAAEDIIISPSDKPFSRTAKGTINRKLTQSLFEAEIEAVYSKAPVESTTGNWKLDCSSLGALQESLLQEFRDLLRLPTLGIDDNLFYFSLDSRQTQVVALFIRKALSECLSDENRVVGFKAEFIYTNPTVASLSQKILANTTSTPTTILHRKSEYKEILEKSIKECSDRITQVLENRNANRPDSRPNGQHVLLTGSTGYVGAWLLQALGNRPEISRVTCLDRSNPGRLIRNVITDINSGNKGSFQVKRLVAALDEDDLGLSSKDYQDLLSSVTCVVHCQWPVDFNQSLSYFEANINGVINLVQFCLQAFNGNCPLLFLSSIATVQRYPSQPVPEVHLSSQEYCQTAYGESKSIASEILDLAAREGGLKTVVCRLGQVCGPVNSTEQASVLPQWPLRDWFPTLLRSSRFMNCLPDSLGKGSRIDWIPVDILSELLADDIANQSHVRIAAEGPTDSCSAKATYYQLVNPVACQYADLLPTLQKQLSGSRHNACTVLSLREWVEKLEEHCLETLSSGTGTQPPGSELLQFFQELSKTSEHDPMVLETTHTLAALPRMQTMSAIDSVSLQLWLCAWNI